MLLEFAGEAGQLFAGLGEIVGASRQTVSQLGDAVGVSGGASGNALEFHGGLVSLGSCFANLLIEGVAGTDAFRVLSIHRLDICGLSIDLCGERTNLLCRGGLLAVELRHPAGQNDSKTCAEFFAERAVTLGLSCLTFKSRHLAGDFVEDVVDTGKIETRGLETKFSKTLFSLEACDPGRFFKDGRDDRAASS